MSAIARVAVIGAGTMGAQIAQQIALHGYPVRLHDLDASQLARAAASNRAHLERRVAKGQLAGGDAESALVRVEGVTDLTVAVADADLVIEAVVEEVEIKRELFAALDRLAPPHAILGTNSSTITVSEITAELPGRQRTLAVHFFNPVLVMKLVEIAPAPYTRPELVERVAAFCAAIGREPIVLKREITGLLVNRVLWALRREAMWLADEGYAAPRDIDRAIKLGLNHPMGPFELADFNGLDVVLAAQRHRHARSGAEVDRPARVLKRMVAEGRLGRKSGAGFYDYPPAEPERER